MPETEQEAIDLIVKHGYMSFEDLEKKLILPVIRNSLRLTANLMSARESYSEKRSDFIFQCWDQIQNGLYETSEEVRKVPDPVSGEMVTKTFKIVKRDKDGHPMYQQNPLAGLVTLKNFEVKVFVYSPKVKMQIEKQQEAYMAVATAKANAQKAEQEALKIEAEGKAKVMTAKYEEEQKKVRSVVEAMKEKEVAETQAAKEVAVEKLQKEKALVAANKLKEVAEINKLAAVFDKEREILLGQGEAERKRLIFTADNYGKEKLQVIERIHAKYAEAFAQRRVPSVVMGSNGEGGNGGTDDDMNKIRKLVELNLMKDLGLDLKVQDKK